MDRRYQAVKADFQENGLLQLSPVPYQFNRLTDVYFRLDREGLIKDYKAGVHHQNFPFQKAEVLGQYIQDLWPPEVLPDFKQMFNTVADTQQTVNVSLQYIQTCIGSNFISNQQRIIKWDC